MTTLFRMPPVLLLLSCLFLAPAAWATGVTTKLLDAGSEPRQTLRYNFTAGQSEEINMEMRMKMSMEMGEQKQPEMQLPANIMKMSTEVTEVTNEGNFKYTFSFDDIEVGQDSALPASVVEQMAKSLGTMVGIKGSGTLTPVGKSLGAKIEAGPDVAPQIKQTLDEFKRSLDNMAAPLPEEPVGIGASWETTMDLDTPSLSLQQTAIYTLKAIKDDTLTLEVTISQTAPPQEMNLSEAPAGTKIMLEAMSSEGSGKMQLDLKKLVPTSEMSIQTQNQINSDGQVIKTKMTMEMSIQP